MNPRLKLLKPYPFERLRKLHAEVVPTANLTPISLGIGEPKHPTPQIIQQALAADLSGLASYPATAGDVRLRQTISAWLQRRYHIDVSPTTQILPVNGSREALFAFAQTIVNSEDTDTPPVVLAPNPFYQIYEGAALLAGAHIHYAPADLARNFATDWSAVTDEVWQRTQLLYVCSPGNPTGAVMPLAEWQKLFELSDQHGFVIASDECYSEIYFGDQAPLGGLEAAAKLGRTDFKNLVSFTSLSKRSNVPGMRSGFVAGDAKLIQAFLLYRTYHGSAMGPVVQAASIAAWQDEAHVEDNRQLYRQKFEQVVPILADVLDVKMPDAGFYLWAGIPKTVLGGDDLKFSQQLLAEHNVVVLPGSYLARIDASGQNPGLGRIRMALVADTAECVEAAKRIASFVKAASQTSGG
jgi:N-succinyldiaminopimelate aminotransferase